MSLDDHFAVRESGAGRLVCMSADWARPVVHWELEAIDPWAQRRFYSELFNWDIAEEGVVLHVAAGLGAPEGGPNGHIRGSSRSGFALYVQVRDLPASLERAVELGGAVTMEPMDLPGGPTLAGITDPEGNPLTLVQQ